ncbi:transcriptional regulator [Acinetobacter proteolyticus]|uniref:transcriptional regulator n=1 Tax=Acinetobacter proteolyticus TaxID=1776741 RepID=UPI0031D27EB3
MTLQEKINYLLSRNHTQQFISEKSGIEQSSVSRISKGTQQSVKYEKGCALDALVRSEMEREGVNQCRT